MNSLREILLNINNELSELCKGNETEPLIVYYDSKTNVLEYFSFGKSVKLINLRELVLPYKRDFVSFISPYHINLILESIGRLITERDLDNISLRTNSKTLGFDFYKCFLGAPGPQKFDSIDFAPIRNSFISSIYLRFIGTERVKSLFNRIKDQLRKKNK